MASVWDEKAPASSGAVVLQDPAAGNATGADAKELTAEKHEPLTSTVLLVAASVCTATFLYGYSSGTTYRRVAPLPPCLLGLASTRGGRRADGAVCGQASWLRCWS